MKKPIILFLFILCFSICKAQGTKTPIKDTAKLTGTTGTTNIVRQPTDSTALLTIKDVNQLLQYLSEQEMKPSLFLMIKNGLDQLIQNRIKEFQKPKNK